MTWTTTDLIALTRVGRLTAAERIAVVNATDGFDDALHALGAIELDEREQAFEIERMNENDGVRAVSIWDPDYPMRLRGIDTPPMIVYVRGALPPESMPAVGVVGTRACTTQYGKPVTDTLMKRWVEHGVAIISGLANGIDTLAHEATLRYGGVTVAVIASGIGRITPKHALQLASQISHHHGAVVSEYPYHVAALPPYFPARNRIISGMSDAVAVIESNATGGALITADFALLQGRPLYAVPGNITSSRSRGTNELLASQRARVLVDADTLLSDLGLEKPTLPKKSLPQELWFLGGDPLGVDAVAREWECSSAEALSRLFHYELSGLVRQLPGMRFVAA